MKHLIPFVRSKPTVAVIRLQGMIASGARGLNDEGLAPMIEKAFQRGKPKAVALSINSPGGSPVQSSLIAARIRRLSEEKNIPVHAFVEDVAASGGYWLAASADDIWVDFGSVLGSIGVISSGFGAHDFLARQGIERRVYTAGKSKSTLDPFRPEKPEDIKKLKSILSTMHEGFIDYVKTRRGEKLTDNKDLFTGAYWLGAQAIDLGLADGIGHLVPKLKEIYGDKTRFVKYERKRSFLQKFGSQLAEDAWMSIEERAAYARFGL